MAPRIRLTAEWVAAAMGGTIVTGGTADEFSGVSIDTRTLKAGELYFGIRGDRFDGADFASAATDLDSNAEQTPGRHRSFASQGLSSHSRSHRLRGNACTTFSRAAPRSDTLT